MPTLSPDASQRLLVAVVTATLGLLLWMAVQRTPVEKVWADEGTYLAMAESLARDGDLRFDERDVQRVERLPPQDGRSILILQRTDSGIAYSKPIVFALLAAPFYALAGPRGLVLLNLLVLLAALGLAASYLRGLARRQDRHSTDADWTLITWLLAATVVPYVFWRMSDLVQLCLVLGGLSLVLGHSRGTAVRAWRGAPWLGTALLALAVPMRLSNGAFALIPFLDAVLRRRFRDAFLYGVVAVTVVGSVALVSLQLTGAPDPYRADRTSFLPVSGYPAGPGADEVAERFDEAPAAHVSGMADGRKVVYGALYLFIGRHTGLLFYFPAAVFFALAAARRRDASTWACGFALAVSLAFFVIWKPENYFGGETFLGNRYFLPLYPLVLLAVARLPRPRTLLAAWLLAAVAYASAAASTWRVAHLTEASAPTAASRPGAALGNQSHAHAGLFRRLPYESTAQSLAGRQDRYWSRHFLRFVDPFATVGYQQFELIAGRPASEILIAHWQDVRPLRLEVSAEAEGATLEISDWRRTWRYQVGKELGEVVGLDFATSPPWRRHGFWFENTLYNARAVRLRLKAPEGSRARVVYLGDPVEHERAFSYETLRAEPPSQAPAGGLTELDLEVRNTGGVLWEVDDVVAITVGHRLSRDGLTVDEGRWRLDGRVAPGQVATSRIPIRWPETPGRYRLHLDLVQEHIAWFEQRLGKPLLDAPVDVVAATPSAEPAGSPEPGSSSPPVAIRRP